MKRILTLCLLALGFTKVAQAQPVRTLTVSVDTCTNADTVVIAHNSVGSNVVSLQATVKWISGSATGIVLLEGTVDGIVWENVNTDTLSFSSFNATGYKSKVWEVTRTKYMSYRATYRVSSGTQRTTLSLALLRRPDEQD